MDKKQVENEMQRAQVDIIGYFKSNHDTTNDKLNYFVAFFNERVDGSLKWIEGYNVVDGHFEIKEVEYLDECELISLDEYKDATKGWHTYKEYLKRTNISAGIGLIPLRTFIYETLLWNTLNFKVSELLAIYNSINTNYATLEQLENDLEIDTDNEDITVFNDLTLSAIMDFLTDLEETDIITKVLTLPYGYDETAATIYYLSNENCYCLVFDN